MKSLYEILGLDRTATTADVKKAYIKLAKTMHPDMGGDTDEFARLSVAKGVLSDPEERAHYDATGEEGRKLQSTEDRALEVAFGALHSMMEANIDNGLDINTTNIKGGALAAIANARAKVHKEEQKWDRLAKRLLDAKTRLTTTVNNEKSDPLDARLIAAAQTHQRNADVARAKIADFDLATEILQRYEWKDDQAAIVQRIEDENMNQRYSTLSQMAQQQWPRRQY